MPHVIVKLWPGTSERQKRELADAITRSVAAILDDGDGAVSVAMKEVAPEARAEQVFRPDIAAKADRLYKKPGYSM